MSKRRMTIRIPVSRMSEDDRWELYLTDPRLVAWAAFVVRWGR